ncbi:MAG: hypothetical protein WAK17_28000, partial [Candidatus Nitrosopolaris sp.]
MLNLVFSSPHSWSENSQLVTPQTNIMLIKPPITIRFTCGIVRSFRSDTDQALKPQSRLGGRVYLLPATAWSNALTIC